MPETLNVWFEQQLVGRILRVGGTRMTFRYDTDWLKTGSPLSMSLPLREAPFNEELTFAFFDNLLPEEATRKSISNKVKVSEGNVFGLLELLGADCAGALSILPEDESPLEKAGYQPLTADELGELIAEMPKRPLLAGERGIRLSLAGAQNKLSFVVMGGEYYLPINGSASTHILKPPVPGLEETVENEAFCMIVARTFGLDIPHVFITDTLPRAYVIQRYDRLADTEANRFKRIHQEDFCQAMGVPASLKYQREGGPGTEACFDLLGNSLDPAADRERLFNLIVFNHLIGNADAHAKNLSLLYSEPSKPVLAPFYDILCTGVYPNLDEKAAMKVGGKYKLEQALKHHWVKLASQAGLREQVGLNAMIQLATLFMDSISMVADQFEEAYGESRIVRRICDFSMKRCERLLKRL